ncbi:hypothetical protein F511_03499 [Dorcoceras hygrometricum]|uniref:Uncharacterized protein n=1 Tax=Dorcoceras hygrometricum TaxID=472368 RepID=A0A2Z7AY69_9LAMI|nr:hypothetical protein F511_03499 [Dorcoceras hygrometricum]
MLGPKKDLNSAAIGKLKNFALLKEVQYLGFLNINRAPETDLLSADIADVIVDDHNFFQSSMLTSSLLIIASSIRNALTSSSLIPAFLNNSYLLDPSSPASLVHLADHNFFQSSMLTSSLLITASSIRNALRSSSLIPDFLNNSYLLDPSSPASLVHRTLQTSSVHYLYFASDQISSSFNLPDFTYLYI